MGKCLKNKVLCPFLVFLLAGIHPIFADISWIPGQSSPESWTISPEMPTQSDSISFLGPTEIYNNACMAEMAAGGTPTLMIDSVNKVIVLWFQPPAPGFCTPKFVPVCGLEGSFGPLEPGHWVFIGMAPAEFFIEFFVTSPVAYVDVHATGVNDGSSWENAFTDLQDGIDAVHYSTVFYGGEVWVAKGIYKPTNRRYSSYPQSVAFNLLDGVMIYGGFDGTETARSERDWINNETVLTGDLDDDGLDADNAWHVVEADTESVGPTGGLNGFTVTMGYADGPSPEFYGGGIYIQHESPTIENCKITNNFAHTGTGCYINSGNPIIRNCMIFNNGTNTSTCSAAIACESGASPQITNCIIQNNMGRSGGGIHCNGGSEPTFVNCLITNNTGSVGGAIRNIDSNPVFRNCTIAGNFAGASGGGMDNMNGIPELTSCIIWDNTPEGIAGDATAVITYSDVQDGWAGIGNINTDPYFADTDDFHLKSQAGRWTGLNWGTDAVTSPCIDAGDPDSPIGLEPFANGGRINMGAYGGTVEASKSYFGTVPCETIMAGDINGDCSIDLLDFVIVAGHWLWHE